MLKQLVFVALASILVGSGESHAQEFELRDGQRTILIDLNSRDTNQESRIRRLERAVHDLQMKVWQLNSQAVKRDLYVCTMSAFMSKFESDKHALQYDAEKQVRRRCEANYHSMHCDNPVCRKIN